MTLGNKKDGSPFADFLHDKDLFMRDFIERNLSRTNEMFSYEGLPEEIPLLIYERSLQRNGWLCVFKENEKMYALPCSIEGLPDEYFQPKRVRVVNPYLNADKGGFDRVFEIGKDCEIIRNDTGAQGLLPVLAKYGAMTRTAELTLDTLTFLARVPFLITAKNLNDKDNARAFLERIKDGEYGVIAGNDFTESVKADLTPKEARGIADVVEMANYVNGRLLNEIGILADYNGMKKERTSGADTEFATPSLIPFVENMLNERKQGWARVNALFGTSVEVDFNSVWQLNGAFLNSATAQYLNETVTGDVDKIDEKREVNEDDIPEENAEEEGGSAGETDGGLPEAETAETAEEKEVEEDETKKDD